jgi:hypothetical protein
MDESINKTYNVSKVAESKSKSESMLGDFNGLANIEDPIPSSNSIQSSGKKPISPKFGVDESPSRENSSLHNEQFQIKVKLELS